MSLRDYLFQLTDVLRHNPDSVTQARTVDLLVDVCEKEYVKGKKMAESLIRIRLGLATSEDNY